MVLHRVTFIYPCGAITRYVWNGEQYVTVLPYIDWSTFIRVSLAADEMCGICLQLRGAAVQLSCPQVSLGVHSQVGSRRERAHIAGRQSAADGKKKKYSPAENRTRAPCATHEYCHCTTED